MALSAAETSHDHTPLTYCAQLYCGSYGHFNFSITGPNVSFMFSFSPKGPNTVCIVSLELEIQCLHALYNSLERGR